MFMSDQFTTGTSKPKNDLERDVLDAVCRQAGKRMYSLVVIGSRATGEDLPDSDFDGILFVRDSSRVKLDLSEVERKHGVRIGISVKSSLATFRLRGPEIKMRYLGPLTLIALRLRLSRRIAGIDVMWGLPSMRNLLKTDIAGELRREYEAATRPDSKANVLKREPRRQVGFIIAMCEALLLAKGVRPRKEKLPELMKRHHPKFRAVGLLRRALKRRATWVKRKIDSKDRAAIRRDLKQFLEIYRQYVH